MKKTAITLLLFPFFLAQAQPLEKLEQAIKDSSVTEVKELLTKATLSNAQYNALIDLSQQMLEFNKEQLKCGKLTLGLSESPLKQVASLTGGLIFGLEFFRLRALALLTASMRSLSILQSDVIPRQGQLAGAH